MQGQIQKYIAGCDLCQRTKPHRENLVIPPPHEVPSLPWNIFPSTSSPLTRIKRIQCILVIVDRFSKMILLVAVRDTLTSFQTARSIAIMFGANTDCRRKSLATETPIRSTIHERPSQAHQGRNELVHHLHPQTDGQTERINQEVEQYLRLFINHDRPTEQLAILCRILLQRQSTFVDRLSPSLSTTDDIPKREQTFLKKSKANQPPNSHKP